jgi:uncharacterized protein YceH (UPF0502 family)
MPELPLEPLELRVLGVLLEKELSTPEYYPLTLNALVNGCNQSTNRDPVLQLEADAVERALDGLRDKHAAGTVHAAGSRAVKYAQRLTEALNLTVQEAAILAELILRGPQTAGELRNRSTRMYPFQDLEEVEASLSLLLEAEPAPLAARLPRAPGTKETRVAHLLGGLVDSVPAPAPALPRSDRIEQLERRVEELTAALASLRGEFEAFRGQF